MGCSCTPEVIDFSLIEEEEEKNLISLLFLKISQLIIKNPFYNVPLSDFENTLNSLNNNAIKEQNYDIEAIIDKVISIYFEKEENFIKKLFKDVVKDSLAKYNNIIPDNNDLIILILFFMYIFLSDTQPGKKKLFKEKIKILLNKTIKNKDKSNEYDLTIVSNLLLNFIQMYTFSFSCFFIFFTFLDGFGDYNKTKFEEIINNNSVVNEVESIIDNNLKNINENISPHFLNVLVISEIYNKIKFIFEKANRNLIFTMEDFEINILADSIYDSIYINNFVEYLFFGENHEY